MLDAQTDEVQRVKAAAELGNGQSVELKQHYDALDMEQDSVEQMLRERQRVIDLPDLKGSFIKSVNPDLAEIEVLTRASRLSKNASRN